MDPVAITGPKKNTSREGRKRALCVSCRVHIDPLLVFTLYELSIIRDPPFA